MKLENLEIENFRQYHGVQRAKFSIDPRRNITVFNGNNGAGKTSLFVALNWCLYGEGADNVGELISKEAAKRTKPGQKVKARVKLAFRHLSDRYVAERELTGVKREDGTLEINPKTAFTLMRIRSDGQASEIKNPVGTLNTILPSNVRTFFLFDGEKIDTFAKPDSTDEVKYAIYNVLKLEVLDRAKTHLSHVAAQYKRELKESSTGELRDLLEKDEKKRKERDEATASLQELEKERDSAKRKIADVDKRLRQLQSSKSLQEQRDRIQKELESTESDLAGVVREIRGIVLSGPAFISRGAVVAALEVLDKKRERGEIPSAVRQQFIEDLLERGICICGRPVMQGDQAHVHLQQLLERSVSSELEDKVLSANFALNQILRQNDAFPSRLTQAMKRQAALTDTIKGLHAELDEVTRQLQGSPLEEIAALEAQRVSFQMDLEKYLVGIGKCGGLIDLRDREIAELKKQIEQEEKRKGKNEFVLKKTNLAQQSADAIEKIYQQFAEDMRERIESKTREIFSTLVWKGDHFTDVRLGNDYQLEVIDRYGLPTRPELSAGERQVLSLSFITAMVKVSEEEAPIVMDTPFGRLSSEHRASITQNLPGLAPQLVLFVTDEELRDAARENLEKFIGQEYRLTFNTKTSCTTIEEGHL